MAEKYCQHCWPSKRKNHLDNHLDFYINKLVAPFGYLAEIVSTRFQRLFWHGLLETLRFIRLAKLESNLQKHDFRNRAFIFLAEARRRLLPIYAIKLFGRYTGDFCFIYNKKRHYYEEIPTTALQTHYHLDDKWKIKNILQQYNLPVAKGKVFVSKAKALKFSQTLDYPLVVKPNSGSLSHHLTCPIESEDQLLVAIDLARKYCPEFIVEEFIEGNLYRATVVGQEKVFFCQKEKANIVGDGIHSISELIETKNNGPHRGQAGSKGFTLFQIPQNDLLIENLKSQGLSLEFVPAEAQKVYLHDKYILSAGCDIINCADIVHEDNRNLMLELARLLKTDLVGIDFICPNISQSYKRQKTAILETNSLPYIDMHARPSHGASENVAEIVWDFVLKKLE